MQLLTALPASRRKVQHRPFRNGGSVVRVNLKGVHRVKRKLADGSERTHYYAWRGGPRIDAEPGTEDFVRLYTEAHQGRRKPSTKLLQGLVAEFRASAEFVKLADSSKRGYRAYLKIIEDRFGDMPTSALSDPEVRGEFMAWRDEYAATPRKADYAWTTLARVLSVAKNRGRIPVNPCERGGRLYDPDRTDNLWTEDDIARLLTKARPEMKLALMLALWTGQRQGDLLRLPWSAYTGTHIRLRQSKSGRRRAVSIPAGELLRATLDATKRVSPVILTNSYGRPWTSDGFRTSWGKLCERVGITELTFHDLRGSAVTRMALAGATPEEIASVTGHSIQDVCDLLDRHYLGSRAQLAEIAIRRLEQKEAGTKSVNVGVNGSAGT